MFLVPSSALFENFEQLEVGNSVGLKNIVKSSTAISLQKPRKSGIDGCKKIEEIVASNDENDASELVFLKLEHLRLCNLLWPKSFCKGRHGRKFPLLQNLFVMHQSSDKYMQCCKVNGNIMVTSTLLENLSRKVLIYIKKKITNHSSNVMAWILTLLLHFLVYEQYPEL